MERSLRLISAVFSPSLYLFPFHCPWTLSCSLVSHLLCDWCQNVPSAGPVKNKGWEGVCTHVWMWLSESDGGGRQVVNIQPTSASDSSVLLQTQQGAAFKSSSGWMLGLMCAVIVRAQYFTLTLRLLCLLTGFPCLNVFFCVLINLSVPSPAYRCAMQKLSKTAIIAVISKEYWIILCGFVQFQTF